MEFQEHSALYAVPTYHETHFQVDDTVFRQTICVHSQQITALSLQNWQDLTLADFQAAIDAGADLILIGTGKQQKFMDLAMMAQLSAKGVGVECMNSAAACRTLLLLQGEGRNVWAWLFV